MVGIELVGVALGIVLVIGLALSPFFGIAAFVGQRRLRREVRQLAAELALLRAATPVAEGPVEAVAEPAPATPEAEAPSAPASTQASPSAEPSLPPRRTGWPAPTGWTAPADRIAQPEEPGEPAAASGPADADMTTGTGEVGSVPPPLPARESFEQRLTSRWLVWLGAGTLALAGVFLVKLAVDAGVIGPGVRLLLAIVLGLALGLGGELLRRRQPATASAGGRIDYVPAALTAAGVFTLFAATYAAHALHAFLTPGMAFLALALVALLAVLAALLHGPLVALLGLVGGYATPLLVAGGEPAAGPVFAYLAVLTAALVAVNHRVRWWPLGWLTLLGALGWPFFWLDALFGPNDAAVLGPYLLAVAACFVLPLRFAAPDEPAAGRLPWPRGPSLLALVGGAGVAIALLALADSDGNGMAALLSILGFVLGAMAAVRLLHRQEALLLPAAVLILALLALWQLPALPFAPPPTAFRPPLLPPGIDRFVAWALIYAVLCGAGGLVLLRGARQPLAWAALSAAMPVLVLCIAYWRLTELAVDLRWTPLALALAALAVAAAAWVRRRVPAACQDDVLACYAAATIGALALAATMALREAWLTVALASMLPALGWVVQRLESRRLGQLAGIVALVVLARLVLNPFLLDYAPGAVPTLGWVAYGYGLPALAFFWASRLFRGRGEAWLVALLEGGAIAFAVLLVTLEIQLWVQGELAGWPNDLLAVSLQGVAWLVVALALIGREAWFTGAIVRWARWLLAGMALVQAVLLQAGALNPLLTGEPVGAPPILNLLLVAYGLPAVLAIWYGAREPVARWLARAASATGLLLAFVFVTLSVRHAFHGTVLAYGPASYAERFSYSGACLAFAAVLLALGIRRASTPLRWTSLGILLVTTAKVFLLDMGDLGGLWRVASFLGLGLGLVAIGFVYQRFVFPAARPPAGG